MANLRKSNLTRSIDRNLEAATVGGQVRKLSISIYPRYNGNRRTKAAFIYFGLGYLKQTCTFSSGIKCDPAKFDSNSLTIKGDAEKTLELKEMALKVETCFRELKLTGRPVDLQLIKATVLGLYVNGVPSLTKTIDDFFDTVTTEERAGIVTIGHWRKVRGFHNHIRAFVKNRYPANAPLEDVVPADARALLTFLQANRNLSANVSNYIAAHFKRVLNFALENEWITRNPFLGFQRKTAYQGKDRLTKLELEKLTKLEIFSPSLDRIRWVFLFDCYTGLSHIDLYRLTPADVQYTSDGDAFMLTNRSKTKQPVVTYLPAFCLGIIERYKNDPYRLQTGKLLPVVSNQKMNMLLKEIAGLAGFKKHLTCHVARHTFFNLLYQTSTDEKAMRATAGHSGMDTMRKHYIEYNPEAIVRELKRNIG